MILKHDTPQIFFLHPGDVAVGFTDDKFETLLGSCVSILLVSPCFNVAAICHYVHSSAPPRSRIRDASFASVAMRKMEHQLNHVGFNARLCRAYVFGGGNMFPGKNNMMDVGSMNVDWAFHQPTAPVQHVRIDHGVAHATVCEQLPQTVTGTVAMTRHGRVT